MNPILLIKQAREAKGWTQRQLAEAVGVSPSFITKLEAGQTQPGSDLCLALSEKLGVSFDELWSHFEQARTATYEQRIRTRGAVVRGALRTRGAALGPRAASADQMMSVEEMANELSADAELREAYRNLKIALSNPLRRQAVLVALDAFARAAEPDSGQ